MLERRLFSFEIATKVFSTVIRTTCEATIIWEGTKMGEYTIKLGHAWLKKTKVDGAIDTTYNRV